MGHLVRQMAVWRRIPPATQSLFLTTCSAFSLFTQQDIFIEYFPSDVHSNLCEFDWDCWFELRLRQLVQRFDIKVVVLDANVPFPALLALRASFPNVRLAWIRRAMWGNHPDDLKRLKTQKQFDIVIEPGDISAAYDTGPTTLFQEHVIRVPPILLHNVDETLDRITACRELGLAPNNVNVCIQLGAEVADNAVNLVRGLCEDLAGRVEITPIWCRSFLGPVRSGLEAVLPTARIFPLAKYFAAFDIAVSAAGYNTFHELHQARIPTVFVPNTAPGMDNQAARAMFAVDEGWARQAAPSHTEVMEQLAPLLNSQTRKAMRQCFDKSVIVNGASAAARAIVTLAQKP